MNSRLFPVLPFHVSLAFILLRLILVNIPPSSAYNEWFLNCTNNFHCGNISHLGFHLWRNEKPESCGDPKPIMQYCKESSSIVEILEARYEVVGFNWEHRILIIAEIGFSDQFCSPENKTLPNSIYGIIPLSYECEHFQRPGIPDKYNCPGTKYGYRNIPYEDKKPNSYCVLSAVVPISISPHTLRESHGLKNVEERIITAFDNGQKVDAEVCRNCTIFSGICGYDLYLNQTKCYCKSPSNGFEICLPGAPAPSPRLYPTLWSPATILCDDDDEEKYKNCNSSLNCLTYPTLSYPFWGSNRPDYCGHPGFKLSCSDQALEITIASITYRILQINTATQTLKVARNDYWDDVCPEYLKNSTLHSYLFHYSSNTPKLWLLYDCISGNLPGRFSCNINSSSYVNFIAIRDIAVSNRMRCNHSVDVAISQSEMQTLQSNLNEQNLIKALKAGFELQWEIDNNICNRCRESGGQCGSNPNSGEFTCYCSNGVYKTTCGSIPSGKKKSSKTSYLIIGVSIGGASFIVIILACCIVYRLRRKKKHPIESKCEDMPAPFSNSSQSIPSYPSSKSDIERTGSYYGVQVFSYAELEKATDNFNRSRELGDGGFGTVYYGKLRDGREVAVKRLYENNGKRVEQFVNEVDILAALHHQNLVKLYGCTSRHQGLLLVYEYISNGTVADHLHGRRAKSGLLSWPVRLRIAIETADALVYLHRSEVIHRDVKTNNILLDKNFAVKVADFGLSRLFPFNVTHVSTAPQGTPGYVDPEYHQCYQLTSKSDVYSFGVVLIELISSLQAVDTNRNRQDINLSNMAVCKIQSRALNELVDPNLGFDKNYKVKMMMTSVAELAFRCLQQDREMRPSMEEVLEVLKGIQSEEFTATDS